VIWLVSPWLSDLTLRLFNKLEFLDEATVKQRYPGVHQLVHQVADEYRFAVPRIGFIPDRNPTAFTYGLLAVDFRSMLGAIGASCLRQRSQTSLGRRPDRPPWLALAQVFLVDGARAGFWLQEEMVGGARPRLFLRRQPRLCERASGD
jgi:hypothetical protein